MLITIITMILFIVSVNIIYKKFYNSLMYSLKGYNMKFDDSNNEEEPEKDNQEEIPNDINTIDDLETVNHVLDDYMGNNILNEEELKLIKYTEELESINNELSTLNKDDDDYELKLKTYQDRFNEILLEVSKLTGENIKTFVYNIPIDKETGEAQWVPYVIDNKQSFVHYLIGKNYTKISITSIIKNMLTKLLNDIPSDKLEDTNSYIYEVADIITTKSLPLVFEYPDFTLSSTRYTGVLPNGQYVSDLTMEEQIEVFSEFLEPTIMNLETARNTSDIEYRLGLINNLLNLNCPYCGTPHNFNDIEDIPDTDFKCTLCDKVLIQYTNAGVY